MGLFEKFTSKIRSAFRLRPKAPKLTPEQQTEQRFEKFGGRAGNLGIAAGNLTPGKQDFSPENVAKWRQLPDSVGIDFVFNQGLFVVHSSNVSSFQYFINSQSLLVQFHNGGVYKYSNISEQEAVYFYIAQSKGGAVWDILRIRGTLKGHKKPYVCIKAGTRKGRKPKKAKP